MRAGAEWSIWIQGGRMRGISGLFGALILAIGVVSCGGGGDTPITNPPPPPACPDNTFCMASVAFVTAGGSTQPVMVSVLPNTPVTWDNNSGGTPHDVVFDDPASALAVGSGSAGDIPQQSSGSNQRQFALSGSHPFHCTLHGTATSGMRGTVLIQ
jgi:plastocyanin